MGVDNEELNNFLCLIDAAWRDPCPRNIQRIADAVNPDKGGNMTLSNTGELVRFINAHRREIRFWEAAMYNPTRYAPS
jgi:hypothetical protein